MPPNLLGIADLDFEHGFIHGLAEVTLILVLFSDAARIDLRVVRRDHDLPMRMLIVGMPLTIGAGPLLRHQPHDRPTHDHAWEQNRWPNGTDHNPPPADLR